MDLVSQLLSSELLLFSSTLIHIMRKIIYISHNYESSSHYSEIVPILEIYDRNKKQVIFRQNRVRAKAIAEHLLAYLVEDTYEQSNDIHILRLWDISTVLQLRDENIGGEIISVSPDNNIVAVGYEDSTIRLWDLTAKKVAANLKCTAKTEILLFSDNSLVLVSVHSDSTISIWDIQKRKLIRNIGHPYKKKITRIAFSPYGEQLICGAEDNTIQIWGL